MTPLTALAVPAASYAAVKLAAHVSEHQPFRRFLQSALAGGKLPEADPSSGHSDAADPDAQADGLLERLREAIAARLAGAGIDTSVRFQLGGDPLDGLRVVGDHPQRQQIEQALAGDADVLRAFAQLAAAHRLNEIHAQRRTFAEQYVARSGPPSAARNGASPPGGFSVQVNGDQIEIAAER